MTSSWTLEGPALNPINSAVRLSNLSHRPSHRHLRDEGQIGDGFEHVAYVVEDCYEAMRFGARLQVQRE